MINFLNETRPILLLLFSVFMSNWSVILAIVITTFSSPQELENFYVQRKSSGSYDSFADLNDEDKERQCAQVMGSRYFKEILKREYADKNDPDVRAYVQTQGLQYVSLHYKTARNGKTLKPAYPYLSFAVQTTGGPQEQLMFFCLSRHSTTKKIADYSISYAYKENERFLYGASHKNAYLVIKALIELPPLALSSDNIENIESFYLEQTADTAKNTPPEDDQLCNLNVKNKSRLCSLVFDTQLYAQDYAFYDNEINFHIKCERKKIKFEKIFTKKEHRANVFKCILSGLKSPFLTDFRYLANAFHENSIFVMKPSGKSMVLESYISAVSVLIENFSQDPRTPTKRKNGLKKIMNIPRQIFRSFLNAVSKLGK